MIGKRERDEPPTYTKDGLLYPEQPEPLEVEEPQPERDLVAELRESAGTHQIMSPTVADRCRRAADELAACKQRIAELERGEA